MGKKLKGYAISAVILIISIAIGCLLVEAYNVHKSSPVSSCKSIADMQNSLGYSFSVPYIVSHCENCDIKCYMGQIGEVSTDEFIFRVGKTVGTNADISGDYSEYSIEKYYKSEDNEFLFRYRSNGKGICLINMSYRGIEYSIKFYNCDNEEEAFKEFGINYENLIEIEKDTEDTSDSINEGNQINDESSNASELFERISNDEMGIEFLVAKTLNSVKEAYSGDELALLLDNKLIFVIKYSSETNTDCSGYSVYQLKDGYLIECISKNPFNKEEQPGLYQDYITIMDNIEITINTFNTY